MQLIFKRFSIKNEHKHTENFLFGRFRCVCSESILLTHNFMIPEMKIDGRKDSVIAQLETG